MKEASRNIHQCEHPLITIGITCFNALDTIERAVRSALRQDWPNKEIVIVDDASTDGSETILSALVGRYPELSLIRHHTNKGYAGALNTIIGSSNGELIAIFDDDDASCPDRLTKQWRRLTNYEFLHNTSLVLCYSNRSVVLIGQNHADHVARAIGRKAPEPNGPMVADYLFGYFCERDYVWGMLGSCTLMARRTTFQTVGDFDVRFRRSAELDFAIRAALKGAHFIAVNEPLVTQYKTRSGDKSGTIPLEYALKLRQKHNRYLKDKKLYLASKAIAYAWFHGNSGRHWRSRLFMVIALILLPSAALVAKFRSRFQPAMGNGRSE